VQDGSNPRSRDTFYRGRDGNPASDGQSNRDNTNTDARKSVDPLQGRTSRNVPDLGQPSARNLDGNKLPNARRADSANPQNRRQITDQGSGQGNPLQSRGDASDRTPRGQFNRGSAAGSSDGRSAAPVQRSTRDAARGGDGGSKSAAPAQRDNRPQSNDDRDRDKRNKDKDANR